MGWTRLWQRSWIVWPRGPQCGRGPFPRPATPGGTATLTSRCSDSYPLARTLKERLDFQAQLRKQFPLPDQPTWVVYNASGKNLRAARCKGVLIEHKCYRVGTRSPKEAAFLVALLNADCLQEEFRYSQESDRDFDTHFWLKVPLPRLNLKRRDHQDVVQLAMRCEQAAQAWLETADIGEGQVALSRGIRTHLEDTGLSAELDEAVKRLLPKHAQA